MHAGRLPRESHRYSPLGYKCMRGGYQERSHRYSPLGYKCMRGGYQESHTDTAHWVTNACGEATKRVTPIQPTGLQMHAVYLMYLIPQLAGVTYCSTPTVINAGWTRNEVKHVRIYKYTFIHSTPNCAANRLHAVSLIPWRVLLGGTPNGRQPMHQTEGSPLWRHASSDTYLPTTSLYWLTHNSYMVIDMSSANTYIGKTSLHS